MNMLREGATKLRQTDLAFLIPPKLRSKGRFQAISKLNRWAKKLIDKKRGYPLRVYSQKEEELKKVVYLLD